MFHRPLGWYCSYCAAQLVTGKENKASRLSGRTRVYLFTYLVDMMKGGGLGGVGDEGTAAARVARVVISGRQRKKNLTTGWPVRLATTLCWCWFGSSYVCQFLLGQLQIWQNWHGMYVGNMMEHRNQSTKYSPRPDGPPCTGNFSKFLLVSRDQQNVLQCNYLNAVVWLAVRLASAFTVTAVCLTMFPASTDARSDRDAVESIGPLAWYTYIANELSVKSWLAQMPQ